MKSWLFVGAKVVCIADAKHAVLAAGGMWANGLISKGETYTIRWVGDFDFGPGMGIHLSVRLAGVYREGAIDVPFGATRFRPLIDTAKTIEAMRSLMLKAATRGKVDA